MKTAVEWLEDNLLFEPWAEEHFKHNKECWDKAKEMEKEQIIMAYKADLYPCSDEDAEEYYNQNFKQK
jgi:hypothetical protein